jgi:(1->4)-alpha-D-glucan 1-alpha-D-glucosylmutase
MREGMTFARAAELAPYLSDLGISHLYLSPIFKATPGSTHGYDAVDFAEIEPELGGRDGFEAMARELRAAGVGVILDIVPNHMAASPLNPWWRDVLEWGSASPHASHFDVDWSASKLVVPRLHTHYGEVVRSGAIKVYADEMAGELGIKYGDMRLPLSPPTYASVLELASAHRYGAIALHLASSTPATVVELKRELAGVLEDPEARAELRQAVEQISGDWEAVHNLHERQVWQLAHWRLARENLTYRRFFEISDLVGVRVEQTNVFDDVHRVVLKLIGEGLVDGVRIDHIDGLADPLAYLQRLRGAVERGEFYVVIEKILGPHEALRSSWPVAGTTGYEFIGAIAGLLVNEAGKSPLNDAYQDFIGEEVDLEAAVLAIKRRTLTRNLAGELDYLTGIAVDLARGDIASRDFGADTLRRAIIELAAAMPVYRTYVDAEGMHPEDAQIIEGAARSAMATREVEDNGAIEFLVRLLALDVGELDRRAAALQFAIRFQQTTGPLTAKALEDTAFYRYNRLIALNEVGGEPDVFGAPIDSFHDFMRARLQATPASLSATATHDTKRGEDARARIYAIAEAPQLWSDGVRRWSGMLAERGANAPDRNAEWMFYQALLGAWPVGLQPGDEEGIAVLRERMTEFMIKAAREAKLYTTWTQPTEEYERSLRCFVASALSVDALVFLRDFIASAQPFVLAGVVNSLTQLVCKLMAPGIPDVYQGSELWDLSLVDPDNRHAVDFSERLALLESGGTLGDAFQSWRSGEVKIKIMRRLLSLRAEYGAAFSHAQYIPLEPVGDLRRHVVAFARIFEEAMIVVIGTRLALDSLVGDIPRIPAEFWENSKLPLPSGTGPLVDALTKRTVDTEDGAIGLAEALGELPVAVLIAERN